MSAEGAASRAALFARCDRALAALRAAPGRWTIWVPGRIEVLGKHTDYAGGRSVVCALERGFCVRAAPRGDNVVRVADVARRERVEVALGGALDLPPGHWGHYVAVVAGRVARNFPGVARGVDLAFASDLPAAAGMSSSTALLVAVFIALSKANDLRSHAVFRGMISSGEELAAYLGAVENGADFGPLAGDAGVGTMGGCQDHTAVLCAEPGRVSRFAWGPLRREGALPVPAGHVFALGASGIAAEKTGAALASYNRASLAVRRLVAAWNAATGRADPTLAAAVESAPDAPARLRALAPRAAGRHLPAAYLVRRLDQFLAETYELVPAATDALARGALADFGIVADRSQRLAEEWLGNQVPQTVALQRLARDLGAVAASAFGAGFGGSVWALVPEADAATFTKSWRAAYGKAFPKLHAAAEFFISPAGPHAFQW